MEVCSQTMQACVHYDLVALAYTPAVTELGKLTTTPLHALYLCIHKTKPTTMVAIHPSKEQYCANNVNDKSASV